MLPCRPHLHDVQLTLKNMYEQVHCMLVGGELVTSSCNGSPPAQSCSKHDPLPLRRECHVILSMSFFRGTQAVVVQDVGQRYPKWLDDNRGNIPPEEHQQHTAQLAHINAICKLLEEHGDNKFDELLMLLQEVRRLTIQTHLETCFLAVHSFRHTRGVPTQHCALHSSWPGQDTLVLFR